MPALTAGQARDWGIVALSNYGVAANATIWKGAALEFASGHATPLVAGAGKVFAGFARTDAKGGSTAGDTSVDVIRKGVIKLEVAGASSAASINTPVYATTSGDFTTSSGGNAVRWGVIIEWLGGTTVKVEFDAFAKQLAA